MSASSNEHSTQFLTVGQTAPAMQPVAAWLLSPGRTFVIDQIARILGAIVVKAKARGL